MPTIKEVAKLAGVSIGTVSNVITGSVPVRPHLHSKVQAAIRQLNYHPNHVARSLRLSKTATLGIIVPDLTIPFFPLVIQGAEAAARERKYSLVAVNSHDSGERQIELLSLLRAQRVEGILLVFAAATTPINQMSRIIDAGIPVVCLDRFPDRLPVDSVSVEDTTAAEMGVDHLLSMGHRRIAVATGPMTLQNERDRLLGYRHALQRAGLPVEKDLIWNGNLHPNDVCAMVCEHLRNPVSRPDAVFSTNGPTGLGVLRAFRDSRFRTPEDIGFVTFDELTVDDVFWPSITTVVQPAYDIGVRAAEILIKRIEQESPADELITERLPATLKVRDSSRLVRRAIQDHSGSSQLSMLAESGAPRG